MYTLLVTGDVPGASTYFNPLLQQTIIPCTSGTRPTGVHNGMTIFETDTACYRRWNGSAWVRTGAFDVENAGTAGASDATNITGITSTAFVTGAQCGTTFVAPPSGGVFVTLSGHLIQTANGNLTVMSFEIRAGGTIGTGTVAVSTSSVRAITAGRAVTSGGLAEFTGSRRCRIQAGTLTPGATYNIQTWHMVTGGTGTIDYRELVLEPVL